MTDSSSVSWWQEYRALAAEGESEAQVKLIEWSGARFEELARQMLRHYPTVRRWEQTSDVVQNATIRLMRALQEVEPTSPRHFMSLAATQIRRELIDLARKHQGPHGIAANYASHPLVGAEAEAGNGDDDPIKLNANDELLGESPPDLAAWCELHAAIERLPEEEYDLCVLMFYQGITQSDAAEILGVTDRTVRRRWQTIRIKLYELMKAHLSVPPRENNTTDSGGTDRNGNG